MLERYLTKEQEQKLLATVRARRDVIARRDAAWIRALIFSGLRLREFAALTVGDVEDGLRHGSLLIPKELRKGYHPPGAVDEQGKKLKNLADDHRVRLHSRLREAFAELLRIRVEMGYFNDPKGPLVPSRQNERMSPRAYQARMRIWAKAAGLPEHLSPHWLRHTGAMRVAETSTAVNSLLVVKRFLGHRSLASTGIYAEATKEHMDAALSQAFGGTQRMTLAERRAAWRARHA